MSELKIKNLEPVIAEAKQCVQEGKTVENCYNTHIANDSGLSVLTGATSEETSKLAGTAAGNRVKKLVQLKVGSAARQLTQAHQKYLSDPTAENQKRYQDLDTELRMYEGAAYLSKVWNENYETFYQEEFSKHQKATLEKTQDEIKKILREEAILTNKTKNLFLKDRGTAITAGYDQFNDAANRHKVSATLRLGTTRDFFNGGYYYKLWGSEKPPADKQTNEFKDILDHVDPVPAGFTLGVFGQFGECFEKDPEICMDVGMALGADPVRTVIFTLVGATQPSIPFPIIGGAIVGAFVGGGLSLEGEMDVGLHLSDFEIRMGVYPNMRSLTQNEGLLEKLNPGIRLGAQF